MLITKSPARTEQILLATISDSVRTIAWMLSEDGRNGTNRPPSLTEILMGGVPDKSEVMAFESGDDFDAAWRELNGG